VRRLVLALLLLASTVQAQSIDGTFEGTLARDLAQRRQP
jgi:hypothetical protein